jgi:hypothetical protein
MDYRSKLNHSNCCGARVLESNICSACKEPCEIENSLDDLTDEDDISKFARKEMRKTKSKEVGRSSSFLREIN